MTDDFYTAFEAIFRGSRKLVKDRMAVYVPLVRTLHRMDLPGPVLDLGCGRGEWLELLKEQNIPAAGVDQDEQMLAEARKTGQSTVRADALAYLSDQPDESLAMVSAFHLVEHLAFNRVKAMVIQSLRVLKPGGILLMETPNPENMRVAASEFHLDPTHVRPIPPKLLAFLPRYAGFSRTVFLRLHSANPPDFDTDVTLGQVLDGVGADYAVVAQKSGDPARMAMADGVFDFPAGPSLDDLVTAYDSGKRRQRDLEKELIAHVKEVAAQAREAAAQAAARADTAEKMVDRIRHEADTARAEMNAVYNSLSWRITRPLRTLRKWLPRRSTTGSRVSGSDLSSSGSDPGHLPPGAGRIFNDLKRTVKQNKRNPD
jgi:O-antigen chain-terminating methyltransferase